MEKIMIGSQISFKILKNFILTFHVTVAYSFSPFFLTSFYLMGFFFETIWW